MNGYANSNSGQSISDKKLLAVTGSIIVTEFCERLAYYGLVGNLELFFKRVLNKSTATASLHVTIFAGTCYMTPLLGGWLADSYLNRFRAIVVFSIIYCIGLGFISASTYIIDATSQFAFEPFFWIGLYLVTLGTGMFFWCFFFPCE